MPEIPLIPIEGPGDTLEACNIALLHGHGMKISVASKWEIIVCRLNASHKAAERYVSQFPSPLVSSAAKFIAFIAGSFAALLLFLALMDDTLLERHLYGRNLVW